MNWRIFFLNFLITKWLFANFWNYQKRHLNRLQREINEQEYPSTENKRNIRENKNLSNIQKAYIRQFVRSPTVPLNAKWNLVEESLSWTKMKSILHRIRRFLKEELGYWYKRGSSRLYLSMDKKLKYMQSIWAWQTLCDLHSNITYINVDESSFTKSVKTEYSWIPRVKAIQLWIHGQLEEQWFCSLYFQMEIGFDISAVR